MSKTYRRKQYFQDATVKDSQHLIKDKDVIWDFYREYKLTSDGFVVLGWREARKEAKKDTKKAHRRGAKIQIAIIQQEEYDNDDED